VGNPNTSRKESDVAVALVRLAEARRKGKTKKATLKSDFHAHGNDSSLWPKRLAR